MAKQISAPTTNSPGTDETEVQSNGQQLPVSNGQQLPPSRALPFLTDLIKGAGKGVRGNFSTLLRRILGRLNRENQQENTMNYDKLKQKLFEAVSKEDMPCNKPRASTRPGKKKMVKACEGGKEKIVHFGAKGYGHNYSPKARKSFKARHKCGEKKSKLSAQYWACKNLWAGPKGSKASCPAGRKCKY